MLGFSREIAGVEDTENGFRRYLELGKPPCPVLRPVSRFSVARSPLKEPEDYLVGQSVVFSTEALIRSGSDILQGGAACVIGFGKLGSSIARTLHVKHVREALEDAGVVIARPATCRSARRRLHAAPQR